MSAHHAERQNEGDVAVGEAADSDHWADPAAFPDVFLPCREPVERLECGAARGALEAAPLGFHRVQFAENMDGKVRRDFVPHSAAARDRHRADVGRCGHGLTGLPGKTGVK